MPSRNVVKVNETRTYYRLRVDSVGCGAVFCDNSDYHFFLSLLERYFLINNAVEALAYCLAPDHFSFLVYQSRKGGVKSLIHNIITSYNRYYCEKYGFDNLLSENDYMAEKVSPDNLLNASRHVHVEPENWDECEHSSIRTYFYDDVPNWMNKKTIADLYGSAIQYLEFLQQDY